VRDALKQNIQRMSITRNNLYEEVWAEPITKVAVRYQVSSNYLARVCRHLNVPYPYRGYWAKVPFGKAPKRLPLPDPCPGEVLDWEKETPFRVPPDTGVTEFIVETHAGRTSGRRLPLLTRARPTRAPVPFASRACT
jgi:hypothetical protein